MEKFNWCSGVVCYIRSEKCYTSSKMYSIFLHRNVLVHCTFQANFFRGGIFLLCNILKVNCSLIGRQFGDMAHLHRLLGAMGFFFYLFILIPNLSIIVMWHSSHASGFAKVYVFHQRILATNFRSNTNNPFKTFVSNSCVNANGFV